MGNRKHSKIDQLDPAVKETVDEMIKTGALYREIVDYIKQNGMSVSIAAVGRYAKNLDLDVTEGILRLLSGQMLDAVSQMNEDQLKDLDFDTLSKHAIALTRAAAYKRKVDIKNKDILENGAEQFQSLIFEAMASERPELFKEVKKFLKEKAKAG